MPASRERERERESWEERLPGNRQVRWLHACRFSHELVVHNNRMA